MRKLALLLLILPVALHAADKAQVYRYTDSKGVIHYTDKPPAKDSKPVDLPPLQTFPSTGKADLGSSPPPKAVPGAFSLEITSPGADETFREAESGVSIQVAVTPPMPEDYGMSYALDGKPLHDGALHQTSYGVPPMERGSHVITATLSDAKGTPVGSASVTVNIKPPVAKAGPK